MTRSFRLVRAVVGLSAALAAAACTIEDRTPGRAVANTPTAPASANSPAGLVAGNAADADSLLVDVHTLDSTIVVDMRYRDSLNFTGEPLPGYLANRALLHRNAAAALVRVQAKLRAEGLGLLVWDAYRPVRATEAMVAWAQREGLDSLVTDGYIADRSRHDLGVAIDCTLISLATGEVLDMGTPFDTFSDAARTANAAADVAVN